ncbi:hypothetical protein [Rhizobium mayense]|uniref:Uncharacterized protein n=1 Tax=Rhizobium mayense TaxID=1312184 RepID=A0ABT7JTC6_9HYPH|nr:hypothetical protein [Rhizobium mayense]MDL2398408.1 hypothetical protein [Rhizobium mayense]
MNKTLGIIGAGALTLVIGLATVVPSVAAPLYQSKPAASTAIEMVQYHQPDRRHWDNNGHHPHRRPPPNYRPGYWNGYHGYKYARPGYRRHSDGWWYPNKAFTIVIH